MLELLGLLVWTDPAGLLLDLHQTALMTVILRGGVRCVTPGVRSDPTWPLLC